MSEYSSFKDIAEPELGNIIGIFHKCVFYKGLQNIYALLILCSIFNILYR